MTRVLRAKPPIAETLFRDNWPRRRKWMSWVLVWAMVNSQIIMCAAVLRWLSPFPKGEADSGLLVQALMALLALISSIIFYYVFGSTWDDNDKRRRLAEREDFNPYGDPMPAPPPAADAPPSDWSARP